MKQISPNLFSRGQSRSIYVRRRIPTALLEAYPSKKTHVVVCLHTSDQGLAKELQRIEEVRIDAEFKRLREELNTQKDERSITRLKKMSDEQLKSLADYWVHRVLVCDELVRREGMDDDEFDEMGRTMQEQRAELGRMLATGRSDKILPAMHGFFHLCGLQFDLPPEETKRVAAVFLGAVISAMDYRMQRQNGGVVQTDTVAPFVQTPKAVANQASAPVVKGPTWDFVFSVWRDYVPGRNKGTTIATQTPWLELKRLATSKGIEGPAGVTPELMREFVDQMKPRIEVVTLNERLAKIKSLFKIVKGKGVLQTNPAADTLGLKENSYAKRKKKRLPFDEADLTNIFSSSIFNERQLRSQGQSKEGTYWIPILMYYTGARTEEIAGLALADVVQDPKFGWYFNLIDRPSPEDDLFDDEDDGEVQQKQKPKSKAASEKDEAVEEEEHTRLLKNGMSTRKVPVAAELIELGLFRYIDWLREKGHKSLFPSLEHDWHNKLSGAFSKFFGRYKKQILGIKSTKKVLYSFRHTMKDAMTTADIRSKYLKRILGHGSGDGPVTDGYGNKDVPLRALVAEFKKIRFSPIPAKPWTPGTGFVKYPKAKKEQS